MNYEEANAKLEILKRDVKTKERWLREAEIELEVWEDYIQDKMNEGRK